MTPSDVNRAMTRRRRGRVAENDEYAAFLRRVLRAYARRIGQGDIHEFAQMAAIAAEMDGRRADARGAAKPPGPRRGHRQFLTLTFAVAGAPPAPATTSHPLSDTIHEEASIAMPPTTEDPIPDGPTQAPLQVGSPASLLALVPQPLGFDPQTSIVLLGAEPTRGRVRLTLRFDLPEDPTLTDEVARHAIGTLAAQGFRAGVAVGYGPRRLVTPMADALRRHGAIAGFQLNELLRAEDSRYWSYLCTEPGCCSPDGEPFDVDSHAVTLAFAAAGAPPVLAGREQLAALVAPLDGPQGQAMAAATARAEERSSRLVAEAANAGRRGEARRLIASAGREAVRAAVDAYRAGDGLLTDAQAAWLSVLLRDLRVRDDAWSRMDPQYANEHQRLWTDLTRRARPGLVAPAASLLAFVAWQTGNGALANVALDRAQADDPGYSMAALMREVMDAGIPPDMATPPLTPEEVADAYDDEDEDDGNL